VSWEVIAGYASGLRLVDPDLAPELLPRTIVAVHFCDALMCRLWARSLGYSDRLWLLAGFTLGVWAIVALMVLSACRRPPR